MPNVINYAEKFERNIEEQYRRESLTTDWETNNKYSFIDAQTIKIPTITLSGYKDHTRDGSRNKGTVSDQWTPYALEHDRDIEFFVDEADVDETNQVLSAANISAEFEREQAIPETDVYRHSKVYADFVANGGTPDTTALTEANVLEVFDEMMSNMDDAEVPSEGRVLRVTPAVNRLLKNADKIYNARLVTSGNKIDRRVHELDDVEIKVVPASRLKTAYDFAEGFKPAESAKQINMMLTHNMAVITAKKISDIYLRMKGTEAATAYGHLYQNRKYQGCWVIKQKNDGVAINVEV